LWAYQRVFHGAPDADNAAFPEMTWRERAVMVPIIGLIVFLGVYPKPVLERIEPSVDRLIAHVERGANTQFREAPTAPEEAEAGAGGRP
jgi:NADH-quinone oxidoreductase subunit M